MLLAALIITTLSACGPQEPLRIGFIGGLSDRNSANGQAGQNAVILAVE
jgi:branched-chain amino acid transport system substrate-binding protein